MMILIVIGFQNVPIWLQVMFKNNPIPVGVTFLVVGISITLSFLHTRHSLMHSSKTYRVQANPSGNIARGQRPVIPISFLTMAIHEK